MSFSKSVIKPSDISIDVLAKDNNLLLRHDIDFSPKNAVRMAELEHEYGARSTYTVLLSGHYYNAFEKDIAVVHFFFHPYKVHFQIESQNRCRVPLISWSCNTLGYKDPPVRSDSVLARNLNVV